MARLGHPTEIHKLPGQKTSSCCGLPIFPQAIPSNWANSVDWPAILIIYILKRHTSLGISNCIKSASVFRTAAPQLNIKEGTNESAAYPALRVGVSA